MTDGGVYGYGCYHPDHSDSLIYPKEFYNRTPVGSLVMTKLLLVSTRGASQELAQALGITEYLDPGQWNVDQSKINWEELSTIQSIDQDDIDKFRRLLNDGFRFLFCPD